MNDRVLVTYGSWWGSTAEVAQEIGKILRESGAEVDVLPAGKVKRADGYRAVVIGSGIRAGRCKGEVTKFISRNKAALAGIPVAVFVVCLQLQEDTPENREQALTFLKPITDGVEAVSVGLFAGALTADRAPFFMKLIVKSMPQGDWRDWEAIRSWAGELPARFAAAPAV